MLEQNHDFNALLNSYEKYNKTITNFYLNNNRVNSNGDIKIPRTRFSERRKQEIREHYLLTENYAETATAFSLNESVVLKSTIHDVKLFDTGNHSGAGRPLTYPKDVENELVAWILQLLDLHVSISVLSLQEKVK